MKTLAACLIIFRQLAEPAVGGECFHNWPGERHIDVPDYVSLFVQGINSRLGTSCACHHPA